MVKVCRFDLFWDYVVFFVLMVVFFGDLGWKDVDGLFYIKGWCDWFIKLMGVWVSLDEVEGFL